MSRRRPTPGRRATRRADRKALATPVLLLHGGEAAAAAVHRAPIGRVLIITGFPRLFLFLRDFDTV